MSLFDMLQKIFKSAPPETFATDSSDDDLYFCRDDKKDDCVMPRPLSEMKYGCKRCALDSCKDTASLPNGVPSDPAIFKSRIRCGQHRMPIRPMCPICGKVIFEDDNGRPIRFVAGSHGGKTVYAAALAHQIYDKSFYDRTGIDCSVAHGREYLKTIIPPLFMHGTLPRKTGVDEHKKILFRLVHKNIGSRLITLHDAGGEKITEKDIGYFSDRTLFLVNPQATAELAGTHPLAGPIPGFTFPAVESLVRLLHRKGWVDHVGETTVQILCNRATTILRNAGFPHCGSWEDIACGLVDVCRAQLAHGGRVTESDVAEVVGILASELDEIAKGVTMRRSFTEDFDDWHENMNGMGADMIGAQLTGHRLALIFSKADLLADTNPIKNAIQRQWERLDAQRPASWKDWLRILDDASRECRETFIELELADLVAKAENRVEQVGFFFISSLGRDTEIQVRKIYIEREGNRSSGGHEPMFGNSSPPSGQDRPRVQVEWEVTERLSIGQDGTRCPTPRGVLYPLLWLLLHQ